MSSIDLMELNERLADSIQESKKRLQQIYRECRETTRKVFILRSNW